MRVAYKRQSPFLRINTTSFRFFFCRNIIRIFMKPGSSIRIYVSMKNLSIPPKIVYSEKVLYPNVHETEKKVYTERFFREPKYLFYGMENPLLELLCLIM